MWIRAERVAVLTPTASLRRLTACYAALAVCAALACTTGQPAARAADGREMLAQAIATTRGSYLVYNFGGGHPMPLLNAGGHWYEMNNGGHLMIIKNASQRLSPHLLVDTHTGDQARCEHNPGARTGEGLWQASEIYPPLKAWQRMGDPPLRSTPTSSTFADKRGAAGGRPAAAHRWAPTWTTPADKDAPTKRSPAPSPTPESRAFPEEMSCGAR